VLAGCGGDAGLGTVTGKVTFNNQPLVSGTITFLPANGRPAHGKIKDGEILDVTTYRPNDGAVLGSHKVLIQSVHNPDDMYAPRKSLIAEKYGDLKLSDLTAEIKPGSNEVKFNVH
jgi:hypothetical protein